MNIESLMDKTKQGIAYATSAALLAGILGCTPTASQPKYVLRLKRFQRADFSDSEYRNMPAKHRKEIDEKGYTYLEVPEKSAPKTLETKVGKTGKKVVVRQGSWWGRHGKKVLITGAIVAAAGITYAVGEKQGWWDDDDDDDKDKKKKRDDRNEPTRGGSNPNYGPDQGSGDDSSKDKGSGGGDDDDDDDSGDGDDGDKDGGNF